MNLLKLLVLLPVFLLFGCASNPMMVSNEVAVDNVDARKAQVVFMRDSFLGAAINASLYDVSDRDPVFIGIISNGTKVLYTTESGDHRFMVVSEAADFMEATLAPGKTYYSLVTPRMGAWKARFSLWPVKSDSNAEFRLGSEEFLRWTKSTKIAKMSPKAQAWYDANRNSVLLKQRKYWPVWQQKSEIDIAQRTLDWNDGL